jgi:GNAT superfamily N-acetyltransferase
MLNSSEQPQIPQGGGNDSQLDLGLNERLGLISLIDEGTRMRSPESPIVADLFNNLWELVNRTVSGSRINRLKPEDSHNGFRVIEVNAENGENLGRLNMLYLRKPIPCYYLVYVEVGAPFRRKGLGTQILKHFKEFLMRRSALGILDNIIPREDPTYDIYLRQSWRPVESIVGETALADSHYYMIFTPPGLEGKDLKGPVLKLLHHLSRKCTTIEMRDNQIMVQRTIEEFKGLHSALMTYFQDDLSRGRPSPLMRFMFTRFVTKLIAFRRRIETLVGYTGGDSLEQIVLAPEIAGLPAQSYAPFEVENGPTLVSGDILLWNQLPEALKSHPARFIEGLPNYERPSLTAWLKEQGEPVSRSLTIGNLMDLGFDPTRLKEIDVDGMPCIFERIQAKQLPDLKRKDALLREINAQLCGSRVKNACLKINPPLLTIRDKGNAYVLRQKIGGIHWEEAVEQIQGSPTLKAMDSSLKLRRMIAGTVGEVQQAASQRLGVSEEMLSDLLACFVSWDIKRNRPLIMVDFTSSYLESIWLA